MRAMASTAPPGFPVLGPEATAGIAALCLRGLGPPGQGPVPSPEQLGRLLFDPVQPAVVRGDPSSGVVATVVRNGSGHVRLLVVDPAARGRGLGTALLAAAEADLASDGVSSVTVGCDAPDYLFPGVQVTETALCCLLEKHRYRQVAHTFNMAVDLAALPPVPTDARVADATAADEDEFRGFLAAHWPGNWTDEAMRAFAQGHLVLARDDAGIAGFCAWDVNWPGWLGPMAARTTRPGQGVGAGLALACLHRMRAAGRTTAEVAWVGPLRFYAKVAGAEVNRVFFVYRKKLAP